MPSPFSFKLSIIFLRDAREQSARQLSTRPSRHSIISSIRASHLPNQVSHLLFDSSYGATEVNGSKLFWPALSRSYHVKSAAQEIHQINHRLDLVARIESRQRNNGTEQLRAYPGGTSSSLTSLTNRIAWAALEYIRIYVNHVIEAAIPRFCSAVLHVNLALETTLEPVSTIRIPRVPQLP